MLLLGLSMLLFQYSELLLNQGEPPVYIVLNYVSTVLNKGFDLVPANQINLLLISLKCKGPDLL